MTKTNNVPPPEAPLAYYGSQRGDYRQFKVLKRLALCGRFDLFTRIADGNMSAEDAMREMGWDPWNLPGPAALWRKWMADYRARNPAARDVRRHPPSRSKTRASDGSSLQTGVGDAPCPPPGTPPC
jgi:hypothetical protein